MITEQAERTIRRYFEDEIKAGKRYVYFSQFYSSRDLTVESVGDIFIGVLELSDCEIEDYSETGVKVSIEDTAVFIWKIDEERWLFSYSSSLNRRIRDKLDDLSKKIGWLLDAWIPGDIVNDLFHEHSPEQKSVDIERKWDPYWVYERLGEIPENLQQYYTQNYENFVEQEIEFSLKTPKALVDKTLKEGVREDLLEKSEISESKFTFRSESEPVLQDGGAQAFSTGPESKVTVRQRGLVVHSTGQASATFDLLDEIESRDDNYKKFQSAVPTREFETREDGSLEVKSYSPGGVVRFRFCELNYDQELSIKLSNFFTVGQSDVDIHGTEKYRDELDFFASAYTTYDDGEYEVFFTHEDREPVVYVKPLSAEVSGLIYINQKLKSKIDPRIKIDIEDSFPEVSE